MEKYLTQFNAKKYDWWGKDRFKFYYFTGPTEMKEYVDIGRME